MQVTNETTWKESRLFGRTAKLYDRLNEQTLTEPKAHWDLQRLVIGNVPQRQLGHFSTTHSSLFCLDCPENKQHMKDLGHQCCKRTNLADNSAVIDPVCLGLWFFFLFSNWFPCWLLINEPSQRLLHWKQMCTAFVCISFFMITFYFFFKFANRV